MNILVTGGAGFIGSHTLIELYKAEYTVVADDNLYKSNPTALKRVVEIIGTGRKVSRRCIDNFSNCKSI